jgi:hypothetical protein
MRLLAIGPKEQVGIAPAQDAMLEAMSLGTRRLNHRRVSPPTRFKHDETPHALPDFWLPSRTSITRHARCMGEQNLGTTGFRHALVVAT